MIRRVRIAVYTTGFAVMLLSAGCGGFSGSHSVSPASMLLPGLMQNDNPEPRPGERNMGPMIVSVPAESVR